MAGSVGMKAFDPGRGHASGRLKQLVTARDILTELLLVPPDNSLSTWRALGIIVPPVARDITGVAVQHSIGDAQAELVIFAATGRSEVGDFFVEKLRNDGLPVRVEPEVSFKAAARPVQGGGSLGHGSRGGAAGTMGCVVQSRATRDQFALTCNHVIADLNSATRGVTEVLEPASGKTGSSRLGLVEDFADIDFSAGAYNIIDAALARPDRTTDLDAYVKHIGNLSGINVSPSFGAAMKKSGAATRQTDGTYQYDINAIITYDNGSTALFRDMLGIVGTSRSFAAQGDSGSVVVDDDKAVVGMIISVASGIDLTMASRIAPVLNHFDVKVV